jgi:hypothetical protein
MGRENHIKMAGAMKEGGILSQHFKDGPYTIFGTTFPRSQIEPWMINDYIDGGIYTIVIPTEMLPLLSSPIEMK